MRALGILVLAIATLFSTACMAPPSAPAGPRTIILDGETIDEEKVGKFITWRCNDFVNGGRTLVEVGYLPKLNIFDLGFVLFDGGNTGAKTQYHRQGINHRWDWGPNKTDYSFVIKPDGTGLFYDFSSVPKGAAKKANDVYKCYLQKA